MPSSAAARAAAASAGHRPRRLRRVADDRPGRGAAAAADHPPLHRREVLRLVDEHVGVAVVLDPVGRRRPAAAGRAYSRSDGGGQLLHVVAAQVRQRVVVEVALVVAGARARRRARSAARRAAARPRPTGRARPAHDLASSRCSSAPSTPSADPGEELGVAQPAEHRRRRRAAATTPSAKSTNAVGAEHLVVERLAAALAAALAADLAPHRVEQRRGDPRQLPVALALRHQLAAEPAELARGRARITSSR